MIGLKDYEQLECMPPFKNDVNAYHSCVFRDFTCLSLIMKACVSVVFPMCQKSKKRQYECQDILTKH